MAKRLDGGRVFVTRVFDGDGAAWAHFRRSRQRKKFRLEIRIVAASTPRWRLSAPPGFIRPCEPVLVARLPAGAGWLHEIKHDGFYILASKQAERVTPWSPRGADFTR